MKLFRAFVACLALAAGSAAAQSAPTGTITATPSTGQAPSSTTIAWNVTGTVGATPCTASGIWSGTKAASGSQVVSIPTAIVGNFTLTCTGPSDTVTINWTPPTTNVDGTPLTNLASYTIFNSRDGTTFGVTQVVTAPASQYVWPNLATGLHYFKMVATNAVGVNSDFTVTVSKTVGVGSWTASAPVSFTTKPSPPSGFTVTVGSLVFDMKNGALFRNVGTIRLGVPCLQYVLTDKATPYYAVQHNDVTFRLGGVKPEDMTVAPCAAA